MDLSETLLQMGLKKTALGRRAMSSQSHFSQSPRLCLATFPAGSTGDLQTIWFGERSHAASGEAE